MRSATNHPPKEGNHMETATQVQETAQPQAASGPTAPQATAKAPSKRQAKPATSVPLHSNPKIAKALAENARNGDKYDSAAALARAMGINDMPTQRTLRQVLRDAGQGVGRGKRYKDITAPKVAKAAQSVAKRAKQEAKG